MNVFTRRFDCLYSRLSDTATLNRNEKFLEKSKRQNETDNMKSRRGCYSNQDGQKRAKLVRNENMINSRLSNFHNTLSQNSLLNFFYTIQSVDTIEKQKNSVEARWRVEKRKRKKSESKITGDQKEKESRSKK